jgi:3-oxoacyl-[acyl-carrier protein] reductase
MDLGVAGQGFIIVGGTAGMGLAAATALAAEGAELVLVGRDATRARKAADDVRSIPGAKVHVVLADVSRSGDAGRMVEEAAGLLDDVAGIAICTGLVGHTGIESSDEEWTKAFDDALLGTAASLRAILPRLVTRGGGTVVTLAAYGIRSPAGERVLFQSLKAAVAVMTKGVATSYGRHGIRANCVCPGAIETDAMHGMRATLAETRGYPYDEALERAMVDDWKMKVAMGRPGHPDEVGELIAFLLSSRAGYLTGALINIDGGTDF